MIQGLLFLANLPVGRYRSPPVRKEQDIPGLSVLAANVPRRPSSSGPGTRRTNSRDYANAGAGGEGFHPGSLHGHQEGRLFHGYYGHYCYLPLYFLCGDKLLGARLRETDEEPIAVRIEELAWDRGADPWGVARGADLFCAGIAVSAAKWSRPLRLIQAVSFSDVLIHDDGLSGGCKEFCVC